MTRTLNHICIWSIFVSGYLIATDSVQHARGDDKSGIELVGRSKDDREPEMWSVVDPKTHQAVASMRRKWGLSAVPPGNYLLRILPQGDKTVEIDWGTVKVEEGKATTVKLDSGVEVLGRSEDDKEPYHWDVIDKTNKPVAHTWRRWGFTPLPPGNYLLRILPQGDKAVEIDWVTVKVEEGKATTVKLDSGVEVLGRSEDDKELYHWDVIDKSTNKLVAHAWRKWGFTPLLPGEYQLRVLPPGSQAIEIAWGDVTVTEGKVTTIEINSGVELPAPSASERPLEWWYVYDGKAKQQVAKVWRSWGFTPLPPGDYEAVIPPTRYTGVKVTKGEVVKLMEPNLADRLARVTSAGRQAEKERDPAGYKKLQEEIERAIRRAAAWLKQEKILDFAPSRLNDDYPTIGILALVHAGELERDPELASRCLEFLQRRPLNTSHGTYSTALTAMALRDINAYRYRPRVFECAQWLVENQGWDDKRKAWYYGGDVPGFDDPKPVGISARPKSNPSSRNVVLEVVRRGSIAKPNDTWDNSNTQFAVLGLHSSALAKIKIPDETWRRIEQHFRATQVADGGWGYQQSGSSYGSMSCAGVASLVVARHHLADKSPTLDPAVVKGLEWLDWHFNIEENPYRYSDQYYYLYGLERVGMLAGTEFFGEHEWYPVGARYLLHEQMGNGSWSAEKFKATGSYPSYLDTCYAILFLRRATLPLQPDEPALLSVTSEEKGLPPSVTPAVELILDASDSMKELVERRTKNEVARDVMNEVVRELPADIAVGLRLYGHWGQWVARKKDPQAAMVPWTDPRVNTDSDLVVPIALLTDTQRKKMATWIDWAKPRGKTPMIYSLLQAKNDFPSDFGGGKTVVLVSDGLDTCGGKLADVAAAYRDSDIAAVIHVVGFDIEGTDAKKQLEEIAKLGGGRYYSARNSSDLAKALREAVPKLGFEVFDETGQTLVTSGPLNGEPIELKPGKYQVRLSGIKAEPVAINLAIGQEMNLQVDEAGKLVLPAVP